MVAMNFVGNKTQLYLYDTIAWDIFLFQEIRQSKWSEVNTTEPEKPLTVEQTHGHREHI